MSQELEVIDRKKLTLGLGISLSAFALGVKIPYTDRSISQILLPTIRSDNSSLYLSGLLVLLVLIYGAHLMVESGRYKNKIVVVLVILFIGGPLMVNVYELILSPIYLMSSGVKTLKIEESDLDLLDKNGQATLEFSAMVRSYRREDTAVQIYVRLPEVIQEMVVEQEVLVYESNRLYPKREWTIDMSSPIELVDGYTMDDLIDTRFYREHYTIILIDESQTLEITIVDTL